MTLAPILSIFNLNRSNPTILRVTWTMNDSKIIVMGIRCTLCNFDNPAGMRFCGNCGARLETAVSSEPSPRIQPYNAEFGMMMGADLAERMRRAGVEAAGQRRYVTILFADISGYTALSERIDSEDLYIMVQEYIRVLSNNVYKYEGVVDKITGDGLMAIFGAPISHENNAERAVRAALEMQSDLFQLSRELKRDQGIDLNVRIGLHSGWVVVGGIGANDLVLNYTAIGDTVNLAHRIEEAAAPGAILVSETVYKQVRALIDCQQITALFPKGIAHPVTAYRVMGSKARPGSVRGIEGLYAPMIGRDQELALLRSCADDLLENGHSQFVLVTGEAGLGKSRLTAEFRATLDQSWLRLIEGHSLAYRRVSYWLIRDVLYSYLGIPATLPAQQVRERLKRAVYQLMGTYAEDALPYLENLMGVPFSNPHAGDRLQRMDAGQLRHQTFLTIRDLLLFEAQTRPLLIVLEDLHWADEASLDLLNFLLEILKQAPIYILAISRFVQPGALERTVNWARQNLAERFHHLQLQSLNHDQSQRLLNLLLSIPNLPEKLRDQILNRSAGVPFYLEEILRTLIDQGVIQSLSGRWAVMPGSDMTSLGVPDTLQELILARFDRLEPAQRRALQVAAVIGKDFSLPLLREVLPASETSDLQAIINTLVEREFILPQADGQSTEYTFRHILMSDAIYSTMLRKERSALHGKVAETIERLWADRLDEQVELLSNHYRWSQHLDRALRYLILAGEKATRSHVNLQARQHYEAALDLLHRVNHTSYQAYQVHLGLGDALMFSGDYAEAHSQYELGLQALVGNASSDQQMEVSILQRRIARIHERQGEYDRAVEHLSLAQQALDATSGDFPIERAQVWNDIAWIEIQRGNLIKAQGLLQEALRLGETSDANDVVASIYNRLGGVAYNQGEWEQAAAYLRKSIAIREAFRDAVNLATSLNNLGLLEIEMGQYDSALANLARSYELKTRLGQAEGVAMALNNLGWLRILRGELVEAKQALKQAQELTQQIGYSSLYRQVMRNFGELYLSAEDWEQASNVLQEIARILEDQGASDQLVVVYSQSGEAALGKGEVKTALSWAEKAGELLVATSNGSKNLMTSQQGEYLRFRGMLDIYLGGWQEARDHLSESEKIFVSLRSQRGQARVIFQMGVLANAQGDNCLAENYFAQAAGIFNRIGARLEAKRAEWAVDQCLEASNLANRPD
jgi:predicted ATPase/class 3 adenylate cyclase